MRAVITPRYGSPDVLVHCEQPEPALGAKDLRIAVEATAVSVGDRRIRSADFPSISALPGRLLYGIFRPRRAVHGTTFAGRVTATGAEVTRFRVGDRLFGSVNHGANAEVLVVPEGASMAAIPEGLSAEQAAALPYGAGTALHFLRDLGQVQPGDRVLLIGASGGVGLFAVQLAKHLGAEVTGVCSAKHFDQVRAEGADQVIDRNRLDLAASGPRYDLIIDIAGATTFGRCRSALSPRGRFLTLHLGVGVLLHMLVAKLTRRPRVALGIALPNAAAHADLARLAAQGVFRPVLGPRFPLEHMAQAHRALEAGNPGGTVVVTMAVSVA
jgi:NADPH:quinone reductase-like Zn-dependent oxidoreductase